MSAINTNKIALPKQSFYGWKNAGILSFIHLARAGLISYAFSVIFPVMLKETGWSRGDASIAISMALLSAGFLVPIAAKILNKIGSRKIINIGLFIFLVGLIMLSTMTTKLWHWIVLWGIVIPLGRVLCGLMPAQVSLMYWFNRKRAMAIGFLMTGAPVGGFLAPPVYTWFMAHMGGWRSGWMLSAGVVMIALVVSFWIKDKPSDLGQYPDGTAPQATDSRSLGGQTLERSGTYRTDAAWTLKEVLKTRTIWFITAASITQSMGLGLVIYHGVLHLRDVGYNPMDAAWILSMIIISSGIVRFPVGWLGDRIEPRWIFFSALILTLIGFVGIWKAPSFEFLIVLGPIYGIAYGTILTITPTLYGNFYGPEVYASTRGFFAPFLTVIAAGVPTIAGYAVEKLGSYNEVFLTISILLVGGIICSVFLSPPEKKTA